MDTATSQVTRSSNREFRVTLRIVIASLVALLTYVAWLALWALGTVTLGLAYLFSDRARGSLLDSPVQHVGDFWQWIVGASAVILVAAVLRGSLRARSAAVGWFTSLVVLAVLGAVAHALDWTSLFTVGFAAALLGWILRVAPRAA